jgi:acetyl-CoA/propionyl-CoA carboxylase, biotin carboxylase, biotin carboxyl carrier protein
MFEKVLVANRGEIAIRIFRTLRELGIGSVAVYSAVDRDSPFVARADEAYLIGGGPAAESYLMSETIIRTALRAGADAVHPGFGFLAENGDFARACAAAGLVFVGPPAEAIDTMGSKITARRAMQAAGVPVIPGADGPVESIEQAVEIAAGIGYPVVVKASAGGGGKGIEVARDELQLRRAYDSARRQGRAYFADDTVFIERYLDNPRHIEVQVLADTHGSVIHLGERDCTIQRRHQKIIEETPSIAVGDELRERIGRIGVDAARAVGYVNAGTVEGLLDGEGTYRFLEMNTRLQVEHTITEMVTGVDLVREQLRIAAGDPLSIAQDEVQLRGHAIQCRINAEDASRDFTPTPGRLTRYREPSGPGVRVDSGVVEGAVISDLYDPMIAKLIVWDVDRELARRRMLRALSEFEIDGVRSLIPLHAAVLEHPEFAAGGTMREFVEGGGYRRSLDGDQEERPAAAAVPVSQSRTVVTEVDGKRFEVTVLEPEHPGRTRLRLRRAQLAERSTRHGGGVDVVRSPMQGTVLKLSVETGGEVQAGQVLAIVEAMKMENEIIARHAGAVESVAVAEGDQVTSGQELLRLV